MFQRLLLGLVALMVTTGCLPPEVEADSPRQSRAVVTAPTSAPSTAERQSSGGGVSSADSEDEGGKADPEGAEAHAEERHPATEEQAAHDPEWGPLYAVVSVYDGDTIAVSVDGQRERVRIIGIDAPEMARSDTAAECHAQPAASHLQSLVQDKRVHLLADPTQADRDRYDRLLRHVVLEGGGHVGLILIESGSAVEREFAGPYQWQSELREAHDRSRAEGRGLWGDCADPTPAPAQSVVPAPQPVASTPPPSPAPPASSPGECVIKGNISSDGEKIYHVPGQQYYDKTVVSAHKGERWFCSEEDAVEAGWRKAKI